MAAAREFVNRKTTQIVSGRARRPSETEGPMKDGAQDYLHNGLSDYRSDEVNADWFAQHLPEFS
jgi:hypothetical protein